MAMAAERTDGRGEAVHRRRTIKDVSHGWARPGQAISHAAISSLVIISIYILQYKVKYYLIL